MAPEMVSVHVCIPYTFISYQTIVQDFRKSRPKVKDLEEQADKIIKKFEEKEEQEKQELTSRKNQVENMEIGIMLSCM